MRAEIGNYAFGSGGNSHGFIVQSNAIVRILPGADPNQVYHGTTTISANIVPLIYGGLFDLNGQAETMDGLSISNGIVQSSAAGEIAALTIDTNNNTAAGVITDR